ncbi:MAG: hypothetical protein HRT88_12715, partial [Lentisphaeraceae bacterium]|nr:hypothetical protein [Lentisphaeraceae bacterium]
SYNEVVKKQLVIAHAQYEQIKGRDSIFLDRRPVIRLYKKVISNAPFAEDAPSLLLRLAILQKDEDEVDEALQSYATLIKRHRTTAEAGYARINLVQHYLNLFDKIDGDQRLVDEAKIQLGLFTQQFTSHPMLSEAKRRQKQIFNIEAERLYIMAIFYLRKETPHYRPAAAKRYLYKLLIEYGKSDFFGKAQDMIKQLEPDYKKTLVEEREVVRKKKAIEKKKWMLPVEATDKTTRKIIIRQGESDKHLLPVEDLGLDLTPIGIDKQNNKSGNDDEK